MVTDLEKVLGDERSVAYVLGSSLIALTSWRRRGRMSMPARKLVWITWALVCSPESIQSVEHLIVWGRVARLKVNKAHEVDTEQPRRTE